MVTPTAPMNVTPNSYKYNNNFYARINRPNYNNQMINNDVMNQEDKSQFDLDKQQNVSKVGKRFYDNLNLIIVINNHNRNFNQYKSHKGLMYHLKNGT